MPRLSPARKAEPSALSFRMPAGIERRLRELRDLQGYWSRQAHAKGILSDRDLKRYLRDNEGRHLSPVIRHCRKAQLDFP